MGHRRLSEGSAHGGWALIALRAGQAILEAFDVEDHGSVHMIGELEILSGAGAGIKFQEEIYYARNGTGHKVKIARADGAFQITDFSMRVIFRFDSEGALIECKTPTNFPALDDVTHVGESVVVQHGTLIEGVADESS